MSKKGIWFLPRLSNCAPDFTYTESGLLQLGTILASYNDLSSVLFSPISDKASPIINWPPEDNVGIEKNHEHSRTDNSLSVGGNILAKFFGLSSTSYEIDAKREYTLKLGKADHRIVRFQYHLSQTTIQSILEQDSVKAYSKPNIFRQTLPKPIYVVSGLRLATGPFSVTENHDSTVHAALSADILMSDTDGGTEAVLTSVVKPIPFGGSISGSLDQKKNISHSYNTIEGKEVIVAYSVYVIRRHAKMFSDASAFMSDSGNMDGIECVDFTEEMEDLNNEFIQHLADGESFYIPK
ncbi:hypothetical protein J3E68DRAFT_212770 [Trichoderma sp. SZMC 28012]